MDREGLVLKVMMNWNSSPKLTIGMAEEENEEGQLHQ